ncbi:putative extracellular protein [Streptococcus pasteurianus ATCC 43144]|uniref:Putative extracellular protein n=1 Tax=Streptococcus pasteurianus (strain ATCC 43144 / JCM 5346 / CCUG 46074 / CDC 1723-81) TaxID=981540 RepID=F5X6S1_STRPX|nr:putative extracellular protein [Streptococcus pasteurianus ATCC 43144]
MRIWQTNFDQVATGSISDLFLKNLPNKVKPANTIFQKMVQ